MHFKGQITKPSAALHFFQKKKKHIPSKKKKEKKKGQNPQSH